MATAISLLTTFVLNIPGSRFRTEEPETPPPPPATDDA